MTWISRISPSSVGKKGLLGVTGLLLSLFLLAHLAGNLLLYKGREAFDAYAEMLSSSSLTILAELGLLALFLLHIALGIIVTLENRAARGTPYAVKASRGAQSMASATMIWTGLVTFAFLLLHIWSFRVERPDDGSLYTHVVTSFQESIVYCTIYIVAVCLLGFHLSHGFQSSFRSLGFSHPRADPVLKWIGWIFAVVVGLGFASIPFYFHFVAGEI